MFGHIARRAGIIMTWCLLLLLVGCESADTSAGDSRLQSLSLEPGSLTLARGTAANLKAIGYYEDGSSQDVTDQVVWTAGEGIALSPSGAVQGDSPGEATVQATLNGLRGSAVITVTQATLAGLQMEEEGDGTLAQGDSRVYRLVGLFSDGSQQELTGQATFSVDNNTLRTTAGGVVTAQGAGEATVTASYGGLRAQSLVTVQATRTLTSVRLTPSAVSFPKGVTQSFKATGVYSDGSTTDLTSLASWRSSNTTIVTVASGGLATGVKAGSATISATYGGRTGSAAVTINTAILSSVSLTSAGTLPAGTTKQLTLNARYSNSVSYNVTNQATFRSANLTVASITTTGTTRGQLKALATGSSVITATFGGKSAQTTATVSAPTLTGFTLSPTTVQLPKGLTQQLTATARYSDNSTRVVTSTATFSSSNANVASVSTLTPRGLITAKATGTCTITATFSGRSATCTVTVVNATLSSIRFEPPTASIAAGTTQRFLLRAIFSDASQQDVTAQALLSLQNPAIAEFTATRGEVRGRTPGSSNVNATYNGKTASAALTVTPAVLTRIDVAPGAPSIPKGSLQQFTATGVYSDGRTQDLTSAVQWTAGDPSVLSVNQAGQGQGLKVGTSSLSASLGGKTGSAQASVTPAVVTGLSLAPETTEVPVGLTQQLTVIALLSDSSSLDVTDQATYLPAAPEKISVSDEGEIQALAVGYTTLTVSFGNAQATVSVNVTDAVLQTLTVAPQQVTLPKGLKRQFTASGVYSDGSTRDVTSSVLWFSETPAVAEIDAAGLAVTLAAGESRVQASLSGKQASANVVVTPAEQASLRISPESASLTAGQNLQLAAYAVFTDGTEVNVTNFTGFTSSDPVLATVVTTGPSRGLVRGRQAGDVTIEGSHAHFRGEATLSVQAPPPGDAWDGLDANRLFTAGEYVDRLATGDFDGDGDLDVATSDPGEDRIVFMLNDGAGNYDLQTSCPSGDQPGSLVVGDLDDDGDFDVAGAIIGDKTFRVFFNDGRGQFTAGPALPLATNPHDLALADLDGDGDLDAAVALYDYYLAFEPVECPILLNDGEGGFSPGATFPSDYGVLDLALVDVDNDGAVDVVLNDDFGHLRLCRNSGEGQFSSPIPVPLPFSVYEFETADMDDDGDTDLIAQGWGVNDRNGTVVLLNVGSGDFSAVDEFTGEISSSVAVGDIDGDGDTDVVNFRSAMPGLSLLLNNGDARFTEVREGTLSGYPELALADVDGDGFLDILGAGVGGYSVAVLKNDGRGHYFGGSSVPVGSYPVTMTSGDFDGDGRPDTVVANRENNVLSVITNPAGAPMSVSQTIPFSGWPYDLQSADLNGDGYRDLVVILRPGTYGQWASSVAIFFNEGQAQFGAPVSLSVGSAATGLDLGDIDNDGDLDLAVANQRDYDISVFRNNGMGSFSDRVDLSVRYWPNDISFGDADKDGDLDLVAGTESSTSATLFINSGSGVFGVGKLLSLGFSQPRSMTFADLDEDGDNDLLTRDVLGNRIGLLVNDGTGIYSDPIFFPTSPRPSDLKVTDMNLDGNLDIVLACDSDAISVLLGDGAGRLAAPLNYHAGDGCNTLSVEDFDLDGDYDIATALYREHRTVFLKNRVR